MLIVYCSQCDLEEHHRRHSALDVSRETMKLVRLICICYALHETYGSQRNALGLLKRGILNKTDRDIPPFPENGNQIELKVQFSITTPVFLDASMVLSTNGNLIITWTDSTQSWNASEYDGNDVLELPEDSIWRPQFVLSNSADDIEPLRTDYPLILHSNGTYKWKYRNNFHTRCLVDLNKYPFDEQVCFIEFTLVSGYKLNLSVTEPDVDTSIQGGEWDIKNFTVISTLNQTGVTYRLEVKREYFYYLLNMIAPIVLMTFLMPIVFLIPARSGEKLGFLMSVVLSFTVFLSMIQDSVPPSSGQLTILSLYLLVIELQGFFTVLAAIMVISIHHRKEKAEEVKSRKASMRTEGEQSPGDKRNCRSRARRCWVKFSCERFFDAVFFILSLITAISGVFMLTQTVIYIH